PGREFELIDDSRQVRTVHCGNRQREEGIVIRADRSGDRSCRQIEAAHCTLWEFERHRVGTDNVAKIIRKCYFQRIASRGNAPGGITTKYDRLKVSGGVSRRQRSRQSG